MHRSRHRSRRRSQRSRHRSQHRSKRRAGRRSIGSKGLRGGQFLASGSDTCVFAPPLRCTGADALPDPENYVSRVPKGNETPELHARLRALVAEAEALHPGHVEQYFNLAVASCRQYVVTEADLEPNARGERCGFDVRANGVRVNLISRRQGPDLQRLPDSDLRLLKPLMLALVYLEGRFVHADCHQGNIALMPGRVRHLVLHDFGRAIIDEVEFQRHVQRIAEIDFDPGLRYFQSQVARSVRAEDAEDAEVVQALRRVWDILGIMGSLAKLDADSEEPLSHAAERIGDLVARTSGTSGGISDRQLEAVVNGMFATVPILKQRARSENMLQSNDKSNDKSNHLDSSARLMLMRRRKLMGL